MSSASTCTIDPGLLRGSVLGRSTSPTGIMEQGPSDTSPSGPSKRPLEEDFDEDVSHVKRRSTEEEKLARRLARQQRNRKSAQVSREKKKAYVDQLEVEVVQLREERKATLASNAKLEAEVAQLSATVEQLKSLIQARLDPITSSALTDVGGAASLRESGASKTHDAPHTLVSPPLTDLTPTCAAPAAVPSSVDDLSATMLHLTQSTCLPAAEASSSTELAQQRVLFPRSEAEKSPLLISQTGRQQWPTAAAMSPTADSAGARSRSTRVLSALRCPANPQACVHGPHPTTMLPCRRPCWSGLPPLRLRLKIPRQRLRQVLVRYAMQSVTAAST